MLLRVQCFHHLQMPRSSEGLMVICCCKLPCNGTIVTLPLHSMDLPAEMTGGSELPGYSSSAHKMVSIVLRLACIWFVPRCFIKSCIKRLNFCKQNNSFHYHLQESIVYKEVGWGRSIVEPRTFSLSLHRSFTMIVSVQNWPKLRLKQV